MGSEKVRLPEKDQRKSFVLNVLKDVKALEKMIAADMFEKDTIRIGAEQELSLIDNNWRPAMLNLDILKKANNPLFTTELAKFNLEANVAPLTFSGTCLSDMDKAIQRSVDEIRSIAKSLDGNIILSGILPTIRKVDISMTSLTPIERYKALMVGIKKLQEAGNSPLVITGMDELITRNDSPIVEACNTGFQVHLQVTPENFAQKYNIAQAIAGPALAIATNSPILFGRRLWHETRIALFRQAIDVRRTSSHLRKQNARVMFGNTWIKNSILEIYKEDIMRFSVLLSSTQPLSDPLELLANGQVPDLHSLQVHNSTVYRWNRPCFGISQNGQPHLRIENRVLPAGPTVKDEMANAALWLGLMNGLDDHYKDVTKIIEFEEAKDNFLTAARNGMNNKFYWANGKRIPAAELYLKELLPIAIDGLKKAQIADKDIKYYMDILRGRIENGQTGSQWMLNSYNKLIKNASQTETTMAITASIVENQEKNIPIHEWKLASKAHKWQPSTLSVEDFMQTDIVTVSKEDVIELVAEMMNWKSISYVAVEDNKGKLVGLVTTRNIQRYLLNRTCYKQNQEEQATEVQHIMVTELITIEPNAPIEEAIKVMQTKKIGCLPVVNKDELVGLIVEEDYLTVAGRLIYQYVQ